MRKWRTVFSDLVFPELFVRPGSQRRLERFFSVRVMLSWKVMFRQTRTMIPVGYIP